MKEFYLTLALTLSLPLAVKAQEEVIKATPADLVYLEKCLEKDNSKVSYPNNEVNCLWDIFRTCTKKMEIIVYKNIYV